jgi:hypothetical protein
MLAHAYVHAENEGETMDREQELVRLWQQLDAREKNFFIISILGLIEENWKRQRDEGLTSTELRAFAKYIERWE